jgi:hypothetical protein
MIGPLVLLGVEIAGIVFELEECCNLALALVKLLLSCRKWLGSWPTEPAAPSIPSGPVLVASAG